MEEQQGEVIEIVPGGKYVIVLPKGMNEVAARHMVETVNEWRDSDKQFLMLLGGIVLKRVDA